MVSLVIPFLQKWHRPLLLAFQKMEQIPWGIAGIMVRIVLIAWVIPEMHDTYFRPFVEREWMQCAWDPWTTFLERGGDALAFPYGMAMWIPVSSLGLAGAVFVCDLILYGLLLSLAQERRHCIAWLYWLSPYVLYISYWHGQLDVVPITWLIAALVALQRSAPRGCGLLLSAAVSAKLSMALAVPFVFIFLWRNHRYMHFFIPALSYFAGGCACLFLPALFSPGFWTMVFGSPEIQKIYAWHVSFASGEKLYWVIVVYLMLVYGAWVLERMNLQMLFALLGLSFSTLLLFTDASIGWYFWWIPFMALDPAASRGAGFVVAMVYGALLTMYALFHPEGIWKSLLVALQLLTTLRMLFVSIRKNDYFQLSRTPLSVGIAGDSGVGKDRFVEVLTALFGEACVTRLSGDDYHRWDRYSPMWQHYTHLSAQANRLAQFAQDALQLIEGKEVRCVHYDHSTGRFTKTLLVNRNDIVLLSGLHALHTAQLRQRLDLKIFLDMEESLRCFWKLHRDVVVRGRDRQEVLDMIERRSQDRMVIDMQRQWADLLFRIEPVLPMACDTKEVGPLRLQVWMKESLYDEELVRMLIACCDLSVEREVSREGFQVILRVEGEVHVEMLPVLARQLLPAWMGELLALAPVWQAGVTGLMQFITLAHIAERLRCRSMGS